MSKGKWAVLVAAVMVLAAVVAAYAAGQARTAPPEVIRAQRFELVDAEGRVRGELGFGPLGDAPALTLCDEKGRMRAMFHGRDPGLTLAHEDGSVGARLCVNDDGTGLALADEEHKMRAQLILVPDGTPTLRLYDEKGEVRALLVVRTDAGPAVLLYDDKRMLRAALALLPDGTPILALGDEKGDPIWAAPAGAGLAPLVPRLAPPGRPSVYVGVGSGHWVSKVLDGGRLVRLEDGSLWEVAPLDQLDAGLWLPTEEITVLESDNILYPYRLVNADSGNVVDAKLLSR